MKIIPILIQSSCRIMQNLIEIAELNQNENNNTFVGEKIVDTNDQLLDYINKLSHLSNDIAIITDNPKKYTGLPQNAKVINLDAVQGSEFDYVVIDKE